LIRLARIPKPARRGQPRRRGTGVAKPLSKRDQEIANALGPELARQGCSRGLDVIGDWLTEINVTSPLAFRRSLSRPVSTLPGCFSTPWKSP